MLFIILSLTLSLTFNVIPRSTKIRHAASKKVKQQAPASDSTRGVMIALSPPELSLPSEVTAVVGQETTFKVTAKTSDSEQITLQSGRVRNGRLSGLQDGTAVYSFTPNADQVGSTFIIFTAKNEHGLATSLATKVIITPYATTSSGITSRDILPPTISELPVVKQSRSDVISVPVAQVAFPADKPIAPKIKSVAAPTTETVASPIDVIAAGSKGLVTVDLKQTQPDKGVAAIENLPLAEKKTDSTALPLTEKSAAKSSATSETQTASTDQSSTSKSTTDTESTETTRKTPTKSAKHSAIRNSEKLKDLVLTPMAGETFTAGQQVTLAWFAPDLDRVAEQEVRLSTDGGKTFDLVINPHVASGIQFFNWNVPDGLDSQNARIRIVLRDQYGAETTADSSDFSIKPTAEAGTVTLLNLNGGETLVGGRTYSIQWKTNGVFQPLGFDINLMVGKNEFTRISPEIESDAREFTWTVPTTMNTRKARIQLTAYNLAGQPMPVISASEFSIVPEPTITTIDFQSALAPVGDSLVLNGFGFVAGDSVIELNGVSYDPTYGKSDKQSLTETLPLRREDLEKLLPQDTIVTITVFNRATGIRSLPYLYVKPTSPQP
jgi:hypothetical protein